MVLFSVNTSNGTVQDTVPSNPAIPGSGVLSDFSAVSEQDESGISTEYCDRRSYQGDILSTILLGLANREITVRRLLPVVFYRLIWIKTIHHHTKQPFKFSPIQVTSAKTTVTLLNDIVGDNIYYWRVQPRYFAEGQQEAFGAWAGGWSFNRDGFKAQNLNTSVTFATPTFRWDMAEGANSYRLQVATDPNFGNRVIDITTPMNSYTPPDTLAQDLYYWRVQIIRYGNIGNDWSEVKQFDLSLPTPTGLTPDNGQIIHTAPTYCWDPLVGYSNGEPVLTAWRYLVQVSTDPNFSNTYEFCRHL